MPGMSYLLWSYFSFTYLLTLKVKTVVYLQKNVMRAWHYFTYSSPSFPSYLCLPLRCYLEYTLKETCELCCSSSLQSKLKCIVYWIAQIAICYQNLLEFVLSRPCVHIYALNASVDKSDTPSGIAYSHPMFVLNTAQI